MGKVTLETIKTYSYHGCLKEETAIGSDYTVNISIWADLTRSTKTDALADTVDYVHLNKIATQEMAIPAALLEHVAQRVIDRIFVEIPMVEKVEVAVSKINPPIGGDVDKVTITLYEER